MSLQLLVLFLILSKFQVDFLTCVCGAWRSVLYSVEGRK